ncbi:MAG: GntR family transcriptional regulator [Clostridia bacterium]|nr:GntR family transcriptional regulator [Clostridia bacterium]
MNKEHDTNNQLSAKQPKYIEIRNYLYSLIKANIKTPDYQLPSEQAIMIKFECSRITAQRAFTQLEIEGLIVRRQGKGTYINNTNSENSSLILQVQQTLQKKTIGVILPDIKSAYMNSLVVGIEEYADKHDYAVIIACSHFDQRKESSIIQNFYQINVSGIILYPVEAQNHNPEIFKLLLNDFPLILVDKKLEGLNVVSVFSNHYENAKIITTHLTDKGHTHIGMVLNRDSLSYSVKQRQKGYRSVCEKLGIYNKQYVFPNFDRSEENAVAFNRFLDSNPQLTALLVVDYTTSLLVLKHLLSIGKRIPEDLALAVFDSPDSEFDSLYKCPITCISQNTNAIGKQSARLLIKKIENSSAEIQDAIIPSLLILKEST